MKSKSTELDDSGRPDGGTAAGCRSRTTQPLKDRSSVAAKRSDGFFTVADVADTLNVSTRTVSRWIAEGELPVHRFGAAVRIAERDLRTFIAAHRSD